MGLPYLNFSCFVTVVFICILDITGRGVDKTPLQVYSAPLQSCKLSHVLAYACAVHIKQQLL